MSELILWNSIATRRRSPGDNFLENGIALLETHLSAAGYEVEVVDWARGGEGPWLAFTPAPLARVSSRIARILIPAPGSGKSPGKVTRKLAGFSFLLLQEIVSRIERRRRGKMLMQLAAHVRDSGCRVLGIKTWYGEAFSAAIELADLVRKLAPGVLIVAGGPHASIYREAILDAGKFDLVVAGSGERALERVLELSRQIRGRSSLLPVLASEARHGRLGNSALRHAGTVVTSPECPDTAQDKTVPVYGNTLGKTLIHVVIDSIGCPWGRCNFCVHSRIYPRHSLRPVSEIIMEIERMLAVGIGVFRLAGSSSTLAHVREIAEKVLERGLELRFSMFARSEDRIAFDSEVFDRVVRSYRTLLRAGLRAVFVGAESGSDLANESVMNKGMRREDLIASVRAMREASRAEDLPLDIGLSLIYPLPTLGRFDLRELAADDLSLVEACDPDSVLVSPPAPFPGTPWFDRGADYGFEIGPDFVREMLEYDYVLYKPPSLWPDLGLRLENRDLRRILDECQSLRRSLEERGFITEVTDEHFLMLRAAGYEGREGAARFKHEALIGILSCDYRWMDSIREEVNRDSRRIASRNDLLSKSTEPGTRVENE